MNPKPKCLYLCWYL